MAKESILVAESREEAGSAPSRRLRRKGWIPAVLTGQDRTVRTIRLSGVAGRMQAALSRASRSAWIRVQPPKGFDRLVFDVRPSQEAELLQLGYLAAMPSGGTGENIMVSARSFPKKAR